MCGSPDKSAGGATGCLTSTTGQGRATVQTLHRAVSSVSCHVRVRRRARKSQSTAPSPTLDKHPPPQRLIAKPRSCGNRCIQRRKIFLAAPVHGRDVPLPGRDFWCVPRSHSCVGSLFSSVGTLRNGRVLMLQGHLRCTHSDYRSRLQGQGH